MYTKRISPFLVELMTRMFLGVKREGKINIKVITVVEGKLVANDVAVTRQELRENYAGPYERGTNREFWNKKTNKREDKSRRRR